MQQVRIRTATAQIGDPSRSCTSHIARPGTSTGAGYRRPARVGVDHTRSRKHRPSMIRKAADLISAMLPASRLRTSDGVPHVACGKASLVSQQSRTKNFVNFAGAYRVALFPLSRHATEVANALVLPWFCLGLRCSDGWTGRLAHFRDWDLATGGSCQTLVEDCQRGSDGKLPDAICLARPCNSRGPCRRLHDLLGFRLCDLERETRQRSRAMACQHGGVSVGKQGIGSNKEKFLECERTMLIGVPGSSGTTQERCCAVPHKERSGNKANLNREGDNEWCLAVKVPQARRLAWRYLPGRDPFINQGGPARPQIVAARFYHPHFSLAPALLSSCPLHPLRTEERRSLTRVSHSIHSFSTYLRHS